MCDFSNLEEEQKRIFSERLNECAKSFGGVNFFLQLLEEIRKTKPHPLGAKNCEFSFHLGSIKWNKPIFIDKIALLLKVRPNELTEGSILPSPNSRGYKSVLNLVRTLKPIKFEVKPYDAEHGKGFSFECFEVTDEETTKLDVAFDALFFCQIDLVKKALALSNRS